MQKLLFSVALLACCASTLTQAAETQRYTLQKTNDGYVRTETSTGETSICTQTGDQLVCRLAADDLKAFEADLSAMQAKIDSLEKRLSELEKTGNPNDVTQPLAKSDNEFKNSLDQMEQFFRRFMGIVKEFQTLGETSKPAPEHTL